MPQITVNEAIGWALAEEMRRDPRVIMFGEGVATKRPELVKEFGRSRVRNTPLAEGIIAGTAVGAAATGLRPVIDMLFAPFLCFAMEEIVNSAGKLRYAGRVGTGFTQSELDRLARLLEPLRRDRSPFEAGPSPPRGASFCEPRLVAEVEFREWTKAGSLRAPSYKGLRDDKPPREVVREDAPREEARSEGETAPALVLDGDDGRRRRSRSKGTSNGSPTWRRRCIRARALPSAT